VTALSSHWEKTAVRGARLRQLRRAVLQLLIIRIAEAGRDLGDKCRIERERTVPDGLPFGLDLLGERLGAELMDQNLDARLVDVVAPSELIVDPQDRLDIAQEVALGQELLDGLAHKRCAPEPAAHDHLEADLAGLVAMHVQPDIVHPHGGAVVRGRGERDLELARQEREFRMQGRMLAQQLGADARILDLAGRHAGPLVGGDVAHAIAAGLHAVQPGTREVRPSGRADP